MSEEINNKNLEYIINELTANNNMNTVELEKKLEKIEQNQKTIDNNQEQINKQLKQSNDYLESIKWRTGCIVFLMLLPMFVRLLLIMYRVNTINQLLDLWYS